MPWFPKTTTATERKRPGKFPLYLTQVPAIGYPAPKGVKLGRFHEGIVDPSPNSQRLPLLPAALMALRGAATAVVTSIKALSVPGCDAQKSDGWSCKGSSK